MGEITLIVICTSCLFNSIVLILIMMSNFTLNQKLAHLCLSSTWTHPKIDKILEEVEHANMQRDREKKTPNLKKSMEASERMRKYWEKKREGKAPPRKTRRKQIPAQAALFETDTSHTMP